ncbi:hypothetical protein ABZ547_21770 [Streptomyces sparsogenes]|uniref:hypothetical protein n=1 Tax=Streptomyces sparsogenes TaxID=67365 RepID=UPI0033F3019D
MSSTNCSQAPARHRTTTTHRHGPARIGSPKGILPGAPPRGGNTLPLDLPDGFRKLVQPHLTPHKGEIARQATFKYLQLARAEAPNHPHRVYYVFPTASSPRVLVLPSQQRTWQIAGATLCVVLVLLLILWLMP